MLQESGDENWDEYGFSDGRVPDTEKKKQGGLSREEDHKGRYTSM